eukprot:12099915-Ditylum_brightwellii.AAC.1
MDDLYDSLKLSSPKDQLWFGQILNLLRTKQHDSVKKEGKDFSLQQVAMAALFCRILRTYASSYSSVDGDDEEVDMEVNKKNDKTTYTTADDDDYYITMANTYTIEKGGKNKKSCINLCSSRNLYFLRDPKILRELWGLGNDMALYLSTQEDQQQRKKGVDGGDDETVISGKNNNKDSTSCRINVADLSMKCLALLQAREEKIDIKETNSNQRRTLIDSFLQQLEGM